MLWYLCVHYKWYRCSIHKTASAVVWVVTDAFAVLGDLLPSSPWGILWYSNRLGHGVITVSCQLIHREWLTKYCGWKIVEVNPAGFGYVLLILSSLCFCACVCFFYRMRCADISADRDTDGQWTTATAVFNGTVTGTVRLVRTNNSQSLFHECQFVLHICSLTFHQFRILINLFCLIQYYFLSFPLTE